MPRPAVSNHAVSRLSDRKLLSEIIKLVKNEHLTTVEILVHLNEVETRDLHLKLGYSSMFDYCVGHLGYSRSSAGRRIQAARCIKNHPEIRNILAKNTINLTTVATIAPVLTNSNKTQILDRIRGKSHDRIEAIVAGYRPPIAFRDRVKPVRVAVPERVDNKSQKARVLPAEPSRGTPPGGAATGLTNDQKPSVPAFSSGPGGRGPAEEPGYKIKKRLFIQFLASEAFMTKYAEVRSLLSNKLAESSFEMVFEACLDAFIERHSPKKRNESRARAANTRASNRAAKNTTCNKTTKNRKTNRSASASTNNESRSGTDIMLTSQKGDSKKARPKPGGVQSHPHPGNGKTQYPTLRQTNAQRRRIPMKTRDAVFERDKGRCTYVAANGRRCRSTHRLNIDHIVPYARGGTNSQSNLRLLCAKHNNLEAKRVFGSAKINAHAKRK